MVPFPFYEPDASGFNPNASDYIQNALPKRDGWGPCPSLSEQSAALPSKPLGGVGVLRADGSYLTFVGTTTHLYRLSDVGTTFTDYSGGTTFNVPDGDYWSFLDFGSTLLATNLNDGLYEQSGVSFTATAGTPPKAKFVFNIGEFVVLGNLENDPTAVQWSGIGNRTQWTIGENLADRQVFADGGAVMGAVTSELGAYIIQERSIRRMFVQPGSNFAFGFDVANPTRGCVAPASIVEANGSFYYLDTDGFYQGIEGRAIGAERVNRTFFEKVDQTNLHMVQGANDPFGTNIWWRYPLKDGGHAILVYDWQLDQWASIDADVETIFGTTSSAVTIDDLDALSATMDGILYPFDSRVYLGGLPLFAGISADWKFGYFSGAPYEATLRTAKVPLTGEDRAFVNGFRIKTDATGDVSARVGTLPRHDSAVSWSGSLSRVDSTGMVPCRADGRLHQFEVTIPSSSNWSHVHSLKPDIRRSGRR